MDTSWRTQSSHVHVPLYADTLHATQQSQGASASRATQTNTMAPMIAATPTNAMFSQTQERILN